jgi:hypothetical protein
MLLLSLNIRGIGGTLKEASVRRVLDQTRPDILFFQETLVSDVRARGFLQVIRPSWVSCSVSACGKIWRTFSRLGPFSFRFRSCSHCRRYFINWKKRSNKSGVGFLKFIWAMPEHNYFLEIYR